MSKTLPPLAGNVLVGSTAYRAGDIPPLKHARKITNKRNWEGGEVPDFDQYEDGVETVDGIGNSDAANAGRTGLPGFDGNSQPKNIVRDTTGDNGQLMVRTDGEGAGQDNEDPETGQGGGSTGEGSKGPGVNSDDPDDNQAGTGDAPDGQGDSGAAATATTTDASAPTATRTPRKATKATTQQ